MQEYRKVSAPPAYDIHPPQNNGHGGAPHDVLYPSLNDFMGMEITPEMLAANQVALFPSQQVLNSNVEC